MFFEARFVASLRIADDPETNLVHIEPGLTPDHRIRKPINVASSDKLLFGKFGV
jgi:hypothetical protein